MQESCFLGTAAPWAADMTLLVEAGMGIGLLVGAWLARTGRFRLHAVCQSGIVVLNVGLIVLAMFPSFHEQVAPKLPSKIEKSFYALATAHAALGGIAELAALYIVLAAGTNWLPTKIRPAGYKVWMRTVLVLWWLVLLLGLVTYARWYIPLR